MLNFDIGGVVEIGIGRRQHRRVFGDRADPGCDQCPGLLRAPAGGAGDLVFLQIARHFSLGDHRKQGLSGEDVINPVWQ